MKARRNEIEIPEQLYTDFLALPKLDTLNGVGTPIDPELIKDKAQFNRIRRRFALATEKHTEMGTVKTIKLTTGETKFLTRLLIERASVQRMNAKRRGEQVEANERQRRHPNPWGTTPLESDAVLRKAMGYHLWEATVCENLGIKIAGDDYQQAASAYATWQDGKRRKDQVQSAVGKAAFDELISRNLERDPTELEL